MVEIYKTAQCHGFHQMMFSELGSDVDEALRMLRDEVISALGE